MGLKKDRDSIKTRYIYYLIDEKDCVIYVGTAVNPKQRYRTHLKRSKIGTSPIYQHIRKHNVNFKMKIVLKLETTYNDAEKYEIEHILKHQKTCLNFYNNPSSSKKKRNKPCPADTKI
jgi:predicted GIY-YIG superfamily endonuclease